MPIAPETLVKALKDLLELEEFAVQNLTEVSRYDFREFSPEDQKTIFRCLTQLREDSGEHENLIEEILLRLNDGK